MSTSENIVTQLTARRPRYVYRNGAVVEIDDPVMVLTETERAALVARIADAIEGHTTTAQIVRAADFAVRSFTREKARLQKTEKESRVDP